MYLNKTPAKYFQVTATLQTNHFCLISVSFVRQDKVIKSGAKAILHLDGLDDPSNIRPKILCARNYKKTTVQLHQDNLPSTPPPTPTVPH